MRAEGAASRELVHVQTYQVSRAVPNGIKRRATNSTMLLCGGRFNA
jgi:hypothetical protein